MNFAKTFQQILYACECEYNRHYPRKKNSFQEMNSGILYEIVRVAWTDFSSKHRLENLSALDQSYDLINLLLMYAYVKRREEQAELAEMVRDE